MYWYWKVRIYNKAGSYCWANVKTCRDLNDIGIIQDFYFSLTGCKMLLEGMSETEFDCATLEEAFNSCWRQSHQAFFTDKEINSNLTVKSL